MKKILILLLIILFSPLTVLALSFDGVDDIVNVGSGDSLANLGAVTVSAWIKAENSGELTSRIVDKSNNVSANGWLFFQQSGNARALRFYVDGTTDMSVITSNGVFQFNKWEHVLVTWDGSMTAANVHIYVNGKEVTYATQTNGANRSDDATSELKIGNDITAARTFNGLIDEVRVYDRELSAGEIKMLYRGFAPRSGLVGYWPLIGNTAGTFEPDFSGNRNHGERVSGPVRAALNPFKRYFMSRLGR